MRKIAILGVTAILLASCGETSDETSTEVAEPAAATSSAAATDEAPEPLSPGDDMTIECSDDEYEETGTFTTLDEAWEAPPEDRDSCDVIFGTDESYGFSSYALTGAEQEAWQKAGYDEAEDIRTLYELCAEPALGDYDGDLPWSQAQREEVRGALVLCPEHPDRKSVEKRMKDGKKDEQARDQGEIFNDGTYRVGDDIQPGTYAIEADEPIEDCYWERTDSAGEIIDNNFVTSGFRIEVTISASDYSFTAERCGEWKLQ